MSTKMLDDSRAIAGASPAPAAHGPSGFAAPFPFRDGEVFRAWQDLARSAPPILKPELFTAAARWLCGEKPILVGAWAGETMIAAMPLQLRGATLAGMTPEHVPRFDLVGDASALPKLWEAVRRLRGWHALRLRSTPEDSPLARELPRIAERSGFHAVVDADSRCPRLLLSGFEDRLSAKFRRNLRSRRRKLSDVRLERVRDFDERAFEDALALEGAGWKGQAGTAISSRAELRGFYRELATSFGARGELALVFLVAGGRRIASHFALANEHTYYLLKPGYDPGMARYGPGHLLVYEVALDARRRGCAELDLLGQEMPWKEEWTAVSRRHVQVTIYRNSALGRLLYCGERLAAPAVQRLRRRLLRPRR